MPASHPLGMYCDEQLDVVDTAALPWVSVLATIPSTSDILAAVQAKPFELTLEQALSLGPFSTRAVGSPVWHH